MTTYVRITSKESVDFNKVYPVRDHSEEYWQLDIVQPHNRYFDKSDCKVVELPGLSQKPNLGLTPNDDGISYVKVIDSGIIFPVDAANKSFYNVPINNYRELSKSCCVPVKIQEVNEGQHLITEDLLKLTYKDLKANGLDFLVQAFETAFSAVFAPAKTYKIGQRMVMKGATKNIEMILTNVEYKRVGLVRLDDGTVWQRPVTVVDLNNITEEEMNHIKAGYDCFTLLPAEPTATENFV